MYKTHEQQLLESKEEYEKLKKEYNLVKEEMGAWNIWSLLKIISDRLESLENHINYLQEEIDSRYMVKISKDDMLDLSKLPEEYREDMYEKLKLIVEEDY